MLKIFQKRLFAVNKRFYSKSTDFFEKFEELRKQKQSQKSKKSEFLKDEPLNWVQKRMMEDDERLDYDDNDIDVDQDYQKFEEFKAEHHENRNSENLKKIDEFKESRKSLNEKLLDYLQESKNKSDLIHKSKKFRNLENKNELGKFYHEINKGDDLMDYYDRYDYYKKNLVD